MGKNELMIWLPCILFFSIWTFYYLIEGKFDVLIIIYGIILIFLLTVLWFEYWSKHEKN